MERGCIIAGARRKSNSHGGEAGVTAKKPRTDPLNAGWNGIKYPQTPMYISKGGGGVCGGFPCEQPARGFAAGTVNAAVSDKLLLTAPLLWHLPENCEDGSFLQARCKRR